jgi:hypothetical protein
MKPSLGSGSRRAHGKPLIEAADAAALVAAYRLGESLFQPMFQEPIPGGDDCLWTVGSYLDGEGGAGRVLRQEAACRRRPGSEPAAWAKRWDADAVSGGCACCGSWVSTLASPRSSAKRSAGRVAALMGG